MHVKVSENVIVLLIVSLYVTDIPYYTKFWREIFLANLVNCNKSPIFSCLKLSFKKLVIRVYAIRVAVCEQRGWYCWNVLSLRPLVNSLYLTQMERWLRKYHLWVFLLPTCAYRQTSGFDIWSINSLMMVASKTWGVHKKFNTNSEIFVIAMNHCLHIKQVLHTGLHYTLYTWYSMWYRDDKLFHV